MADRKQLDWTKTGTVKGMAEWLRKQSDALLVVVIRAEDAVVVGHPEIKARDLDGVFDAGIGEAVERMQRHEAAGTAKALLRQDRKGGR